MQNEKVFEILDRLDRALAGIQDGVVDEMDMEEFDALLDMLKGLAAEQIEQFVDEPKEQRNVARMRMLLGMAKLYLLF